MLSQYQANPREGNVEGLHLIFHYLWKSPCMRIVHDPTELDVDAEFNIDTDWTKFYGDIIEEDPPIMLEPLGKLVTITTFVNANHAGNVVTRRPRFRMLFFVQNVPIITYNKRQSSIFVLELVAKKIACDLIPALWIS